LIAVLGTLRLRIGDLRFHPFFSPQR
jgi:hypothetical protein